MKKRNVILFLLLGFICITVATGMKPALKFPPLGSDGFIYKSVNSVVQFKLTGTPAAGETYLWDFGDATSSTLANPSHIYNSANNYQVKLKITYSGGAYTNFYKKVTTLNFPSPISYSINSGCVDVALTITYSSSDLIPLDATYEWNFGDGSPVSKVKAPQHIYTVAGAYNVKFKFKAVIVDGQDSITYNSAEKTQAVNITTCPVAISKSPKCCEGSFAPIPGQTYIVSAWVKEKAPGVQNATNYPNPSITIGFSGAQSFGPFKAKGLIIDGWQRIEREFKVPDNATYISIQLNNDGDNEVFFDDVRVFPTRGNMKSFVYDPITKRLMAELDQNNYATMYEYDEEGNRVRVKRETARGIMTVSESRSAAVKKK
jgi:hypothetical protein